MSCGCVRPERRLQQPAPRVRFHLVQIARRNRLLGGHDDEARNRESLTLAALIQSCDLLPKAGDVFQKESIARFGFAVKPSPFGRGLE